MCNDDEIVLMYDGDDWFPHKDVLQRINREYQDDNIWMTYGNCIFASNGQLCSWSMPFPDKVIKNNTFREWPHGVTHLRTFYAWLFKQIKVEDLMYNGDFYPMTYDVAMCHPMIEMAAYHHKYIHDPLYVYNDLNDINDHKRDQSLQLYLNKHIRARQRYQPLSKPVKTINI